MNDLEWMENKLAQARRSKIVNDYFDGAILYRVFGFINGQTKWRDVFATSEDEARDVILESIADFDIDEIKALPESDQ